MISLCGRRQKGTVAFEKQNLMKKLVFVVSFQGYHSRLTCLFVSSFLCGFLPFFLNSFCLVLHSIWFSKYNNLTISCYDQVYDFFIRIMLSIMKHIPSPPSPKKVLSKNVKSYIEESGKLLKVL